MSRIEIALLIALVGFIVLAIIYCSLVTLVWNFIS